MIAVGPKGRAGGTGRLKAVGLFAALSGVALAALLADLRMRDISEAGRLRDMLLASQAGPAIPFDPAMIEGLPEPARRYLGAAIAPGTPLRTVARIEMEGRLSLGSAGAPSYMPMRAVQTLAPPAGFLWEVTAGSGAGWVTGSDAAGPEGSWSRFRLWGAVPVARAGGDADHALGSFGRYIAEGLFWTPAAYLPGPGVAWEGIGPDSARVTVRHGGMSQSVDLTVDAEGRAVEVSFDRWSNENPEAQWRWQRFGGALSAHRTFGGYTLPTHVEAGNRYGTPEHFPFFIADVTDVRFPEAAAAPSSLFGPPSYGGR